jgi:2-methylcitrate dehydratase
MAAAAFAVPITECAMSDAIPRRNVVLGTATLGLSALARPRVARAAEAAWSEQPAHPLAERLAAYADGLRYTDIDPATIEAVKTHFVDTMGCAIAALDEKPVRACRLVALAAGSGGTSTVIGTSSRSTPELAAFANSVAGRYYDLNDVYVVRQAGHPSDIIAACLAVAEAERASASDLITAIVVAYEVNCRLFDAFDLSERGWDGTVFTLPAAALAAGKLMKLDREKLEQAVNISLNDHIPLGQTRAQTLSDWKGIADADAVRNGVFAAMLARAGVTGPAPVFEGKVGFFHLVSGKSVDVDIERFGGRGGRGGRDNPFRIHQVGMKAFPAQVYTQTAIIAATAIAKEAGGTDRIAAIDIATTRRGYQMAGSEEEKWAPDTRDTADHSLPYIVARAMFDGDITNASYTAEKLRDPRILAFMRKIKVSEDPALTALKSNAPPTRITVSLDDGKRISRQVGDVPGFGGRPMERPDAERKFRGNVAKRWPEQRIASALEAMWALDRADDVGQLLGKLATQSNL